MALDPHRAGGDALRAAHRNEQARELLAVAPAVGKGPRGALQLAVAVFHLLAHGVVERLHLPPAGEILAGGLRELDDLRVPCFDIRAGAEEGPQGPIGLLRGSERGGVGRGDDGRPVERKRHDRAGRFTSRQVGNLHHHLLHATGQRAIPQRPHVGREILRHDHHLLFGPVGRHRERGVEAPAGTAVGRHLEAHLELLLPRVAERGAGAGLLRLQKLAPGREGGRGDDEGHEACPNHTADIGGHGGRRSATGGGCGLGK